MLQFIAQQASQPPQPPADLCAPPSRIKWTNSSRHVGHGQHHGAAKGAAAATAEDSSPIPTVTLHSTIVSPRRHDATSTAAAIAGATATGAAHSDSKHRLRYLSPGGLEPPSPLVSSGGGGAAAATPSPRRPSPIRKHAPRGYRQHTAADATTAGGEQYPERGSPTNNNQPSPILVAAMQQQQLLPVLPPVLTASTASLQAFLSAPPVTVAPYQSPPTVQESLARGLHTTTVAGLESVSSLKLPQISTNARDHALRLAATTDANLCAIYAELGTQLAEKPGATNATKVRAIHDYFQHIWEWEPEQLCFVHWPVIDKELALWQSVTADLSTQVRLHCEERGALLARCHDRIFELIRCMHRSIVTLKRTHSEMEAAHASKCEEYELRLKSLGLTYHSDQSSTAVYTSKLQKENEELRSNLLNMQRNRWLEQEAHRLRESSKKSIGVGGTEALVSLVSTGVQKDFPPLRMGVRWLRRKRKHRRVRIPTEGRSAGTGAWRDQVVDLEVDSSDEEVGLDTDLVRPQTVKVIGMPERPGDFMEIANGRRTIGITAGFSVWDPKFSVGVQVTPNMISSSKTDLPRRSSDQVAIVRRNRELAPPVEFHIPSWWQACLKDFHIDAPVAPMQLIEIHELLLALLQAYLADRHTGKHSMDDLPVFISNFLLTNTGTAAMVQVKLRSLISALKLYYGRDVGATIMSRFVGMQDAIPNAGLKWLIRLLDKIYDGNLQSNIVASMPEACVPHRRVVNGFRRELARLPDLATSFENYMSRVQAVETVPQRTLNPDSQKLWQIASEALFTIKAGREPPLFAQARQLLTVQSKDGASQLRLLSTISTSSVSAGLEAAAAEAAAGRNMLLQVAAGAAMAACCVHQLRRSQNDQDYSFPMSVSDSDNSLLFSAVLAALENTQRATATPAVVDASAEQVSPVQRSIYLAVQVMMMDRGRKTRAAAARIAHVWKEVLRRVRLKASQATSRQHDPIHVFHILMVAISAWSQASALMQRRYRKLFKEADADGNGTLDFQEFKWVLSQMQVEQHARAGKDTELHPIDDEVARQLFMTMLAESPTGAITADVFIQVATSSKISLL